MFEAVVYIVMIFIVLGLFFFIVYDVTKEFKKGLAEIRRIKEERARAAKVEKEESVKDG